LRRDEPTALAPVLAIHRWMRPAPKSLLEMVRMTYVKLKLPLNVQSAGETNIVPTVIQILQECISANLTCIKECNQVEWRVFGNIT
jgi:hypothetical protein